MINFEKILGENPIIGSIRNDEQLNSILNSSIKIVFVLYGSILNIHNICSQLKNNSKIVFVNVDMIEGLKGDKLGIEFIKEAVNPDGIISANNKILKYSINMGIFTIQRLFILDSNSIKTGLNNVNSIKPNAIEILPGISPRAIELIKPCVDKPIITGGLICSKKDVVSALGAGALGVSTSCMELW